MINPRQTKLGGLFDSFSNEQSAPLESMLPPDDPNEGKETKLKPKTLIGMFNNSLSQLSTHTMSTHSAMPSSHSVATAYSSSSHSTSGQASTSNVLLSISSFEINQFEAMTTRLRNLFQPYENLHSGNYNYNHNTEEIASYDTENYSPVDANGRMRRTSSGDENEVLILTNRLKSQESLNQCYQAIPELFFSPDPLECNNDEQFHNIYGDFDVNILIELIKLSHVESQTPHTPSSKSSSKSNKVNLLRLRQNKLSSYLDTIDMTLQRVLYLHSPVFFRTLHTVEALRQEVAVTLQGVVRCSRERLQVCDSNVTAVVRAVPKLLQKKERLNSVAALLETVKLIRDYREKVISLMKKGEYIQALEQISEVKSVIKSQPEFLRMEPVKVMDMQLDAYSTQCCNNLNRLFEMEYGGGSGR